MPNELSPTEDPNTQQNANGEIVLPVDDPDPEPLTPDLLKEIEQDPLLVGVAVVARRYVDTTSDE